MAVALPRERWTDERLDDLNKKVDKGFEDVRVEMRGGFARVDGEIRELRTEMNARFDALNRILLSSAVVIIAALLGTIATLIGTTVL